MRNRVIAFDLDDVLCYRTSDIGHIDKYYSCEPIEKMIKIVNECYDGGAQIIIYTARGMTSLGGNVDNIYNALYGLTQKQLSDWGVKYHKLIMGKAHYDLLIDDKVVNSTRIKSAKDVERNLV